MYIDDILTGAPDDDCAVQLKDDLCNLLSKGGFPLTKWASNSQKVMEATPLREITPTQTDYAWVDKRTQFQVESFRSKQSSRYPRKGCTKPVEILPRKPESCRLSHKRDFSISAQGKRTLVEWSSMVKAILSSLASL